MLVLCPSTPPCTHVLDVRFLVLAHVIVKNNDEEHSRQKVEEKSSLKNYDHCENKR